MSSWGLCILKYFKVGVSEVIACGFVTFATVLRIVLVGLGWPFSNSDEGTIGLMARHIAYRGEHPIFFYGQNYMGATEAYLGAGLFHIFGSSLFVLRLGLIMLIAVFLMSSYLLASMLFTKKLALAALILLSLGSTEMLRWQLTAIGGYPETLVFGSLAFLLASWLALSYKRSQRQRWLRYPGYGCWGLVAGLGLWSDLLILPFVLMSGTLLVLFCWRELLSFASLFLIAGIVLGGFPLLAYNLHASPGQDSLSILLSLHKANTTMADHSLLLQLVSGIRISLPTATGSPFCLGSELSLFGSPVPNTLPCIIFQTGWGLGYILLWTTAIFLTIWSLWKLRFRAKMDVIAADDRLAIVGHFARLLLLTSAGVTLLLFVISPSAASWPAVHAHYLIGLLIATPAMLWPLWRGARSLKHPWARLANLKGAVCGAVLLFLGFSFLFGTINIFPEIAAVQASNQQQDAFISDLLHVGARHIYTDYWTCDRIAFISQERIICGIIDNNLQASHNRYSHYYSIVKADPHSAYVYPLNLPLTSIIVRKVHLSGGNYRRYVFDGYVVYLPKR